MSQARLTRFLQLVAAANKDFTEKRSSLKALLATMRQQVASGNFALAPLQPLLVTVRADKRGAKYQTALQYLERVWGKAALQYKGPNQAAYTDVPARLFILKGTQVGFNEVDTDTVQNHTFSVNSASSVAGSETVVNLVFGANTYPVRAVVFELTATVAFEDNFVGRSVDDLGVNEQVTLGFTVVPAGVTAAEAGGLLWSIDGTGGLDADRAHQIKGKIQRAKTNTAVPANDGIAYYFAAWATDAQQPTGPRPTKRSAPVALNLRVQAGPSTGLGIQKTFTVHTPIARMVARAPWKHVQGRPSAGFIGDIYFDPKNVSFKFVKFREGRGTMVARQTGYKQAPSMALNAPKPKPLPGNPSGCFAWEGARIHAHTGIWVDILGGDSTNGCKLNGADTVYTAPNPRWPNKYQAADGPGLEGKDTDVPSELIWPIYWQYQAPGIAAHVITQQAKHESIMDAQGTVTTKKAGAQVIRLLNDPSA